MNRSIEHVGITVPDAERVTAFLSAALGGELVYEGLSRADPPDRRRRRRARGSKRPTILVWPRYLTSELCKPMKFNRR